MAVAVSVKKLLKVLAVSKSFRNFAPELNQNQQIMKYRARITRILSSVENIYELRGHVVNDMKDAYLEVDTEQEADIIERMNTLKTEFDKLRIQLICLNVKNK